MVRTGYICWPLVFFLFAVCDCGCCGPNVQRFGSKLTQCFVSDERTRLQYRNISNKLLALALFFRDSTDYTANPLQEKVLFVKNKANAKWDEAQLTDERTNECTALTIDIDEQEKLLQSGLCAGLRLLKEG